MSDTTTHAHAWLRWRSNKKRRAWRMWEPTRVPDQLRAQVECDLREYDDTWTGRLLDYVTNAYLHAWDAARYHRKMRRRASDRLFHTRPESRRRRELWALYFQSLEVDPNGTCPGCILGSGYAHLCEGSTP